MKRLIGLSFILLVVCFAQQALNGQTVAQNKSLTKAGLVSLAKTTENKEELNVKSMDAQVGKAYRLYKNVIASLETKPKHKLFVVRETIGMLSLDSQYVVININTYLSPRTLKGEKTDFREFPISNVLSLQDVAGNVLWTKIYDWAGTDDGGIGVGKVLQGAKSILAFMSDTAANAPESEFPDIIVVYNKIGKEVYRVMLSGREPINPGLTKNGRYFYMGESKPWPTNNEEIWTIVDLKKRGHIGLTIHIGEESRPEINDVGKIHIRLKGYKEKWFTFDSLNSQQNGQEHEK